jgi:hypothetical protein
LLSIAPLSLSWPSVVHAGARQADSLAAAPRSTQTATLEAKLLPEHLGESTTIAFHLKVRTPSGELPSPVTAVALRYPANVGLVGSGLGIATCSVAMIEQAPRPKDRGCPADSRVGYGTVLAEIPFGPDLVREYAHVDVFMAPLQDGYLGLIFDTVGQTPVAAEIILPGLVLPSSAPFGGHIQIAVPIVEALPEGPDAAVVELNTTIGPKHIVYFQRRKGYTIAYKPRGLILPGRCPRGGFPFSAELGFQDGTQTTARTSVPCPVESRRQRHARRARS